MPRFFAQFDAPGRVVITGRDVHHITGPLRKGVGDELPIRVGEDGCMGRILSLGRKEIVLEVLYPQELRDRGSARVHLGISLIDLKEMDDLIRCVTELGVAEIHPLIAGRSNVRDLRDKTFGRWQQIVLEAVKQCERRTLPVIHEPLALERMLQEAPGAWPVRLVASIESDTPVESMKAPEAGILIGPEGGFSPREQEGILASGFIPVHMGRTILRASTAAAAAVGILAM